MTRAEKAIAWLNNRVNTRTNYNEPDVLEILNAFMEIDQEATAVGQDDMIAVQFSDGSKALFGGDDLRLPQSD